MREPLHVTTWHDGGDGTPAVLVHGTLTWATRCYAAQRPLAADRPVLLPDRRGFGASPDLTDNAHTSDYDVDADDIISLLGDGAHLVGHSYGGVVAMLVAGRRPDLIRSLALIEPSASMVAIDDPLVAEQTSAAVAFMTDARRRPVEYYLGEVFGPVTPEPVEQLRRAAHTALHERPCWLADIPTEPLARADFRKLVITGAWDGDAPGYRPGAGDLARRVSSVVAEKIGARLEAVPGAHHEPHRDQPELTHALLRTLWS